MAQSASRLRSRKKTTVNETELQENTAETTSVNVRPSIPRYTIDLSSPPISRYQHVAKDFLPQLASLTPLFSEVVPRPIFRKLARLLLRRLHSKEQTSELRGIQRVTKIGMHLLVALNVLLDLMMGCTSGGVRVQNRGSSSRMLHFRTLDWAMDPLRKIIVHLDYVREGGVKVAECVTYLGYVGVLTGVTRDLSVSLNFRPVHDATTTRVAQLRFYMHHALVLFGFRPSIASMLRELVIPPSEPTSLREIEQRLPNRVTTAAYLIFCDGQRTLTLEKDHRSAVLNSSPDFIVVTNHDRAQERAHPISDEQEEEEENTSLLNGLITRINTHGIVAESTARKECITRMWTQLSQHQKRRLDTRTLARWMDTYPITNSMTHFAVIMDPVEGGVVWEKCYPDARELWDRLNGRV